MNDLSFGARQAHSIMSYQVYEDSQYSGSIRHDDGELHGRSLPGPCPWLEPILAEIRYSFGCEPDRHTQTQSSVFSMGRENGRRYILDHLRIGHAKIRSQISQTTFPITCLVFKIVLCFSHVSSYVPPLLRIQLSNHNEFRLEFG